MTIRARVAKILDEEHILLSAGEEDGVRIGMLFVIFDEGEEVKNPETGESLGRVERVKGMVVVSHVQERLCQATPPETVVEDPESTVLSARLSWTDPTKRGGKKREKLYIRSHEASGWTPPGPISVGDPARSLEETSGEVSG